jgi:O-antigen ligase/tetratricopeptide (TPR) repeat protein
MNYEKIFGRILTVGILATLCIPFTVSESMLFPFISGKGFVFRILVEILFALWLGGMYWFKDFRPKFSWIQVSVLVFGLVVFLADVFGVSFYRSFWSNFERMEGMIAVLHIIAYFLVASSVLKTRSVWNWFFNTSVAASAVMSIYVFLQLAGKITINQGGVRVDGTFGNATYLAVYMLCNIFIALFLMARIYQNRAAVSNPAVWYVGYGIAIVCQVISLYYTATRGAILGLLGGLLLTALMIVILEKQRSMLKKISIGVLVGVFVLSGGFLAIRKTDFVLNSPTLARFASISIEQISTQGRRYIWPMAMQGFAERPVLGWGQENFNYIFNKYYDPRMYAQEQWFDRAHNVVLDWLVAGGVLGFLAYLSLFAALLYLLFKNKNLSTVDKSILVGLIAAYFFHNLFVFDNLISYIYFFSLLAFVHAMSVEGKPDVNWITRFFENKKYAPVLKFGLPVVSAVVAITLLYSWNLKPILASKNILYGLSSIQPGQYFNPQAGLEFFKKAYTYETFADNEATEQLFNQTNLFLNEAVPAQIRSDYAQFTAMQFDRMIARNKNDARTLLFAGTFRAQIGDLQNALPYLDQAEKESMGKQSVKFEKGLVYMGLGQHDKSLEYFKKAYELAPGNTESVILYAIAAVEAKNNQLANVVLAQVDKDTASRDERLIATLAANDRVMDAIKLIEHRISIEPNNSQLPFRLAAGYLSLNQRVKSVEILKKAIIDFPENKKQLEYYIKEIQEGRNP